MGFRCASEFSVCQRSISCPFAHRERDITPRFPIEGSGATLSKLESSQASPAESWRLGGGRRPPPAQGRHHGRRRVATTAATAGRGGPPLMRTLGPRQRCQVAASAGAGSPPRQAQGRHHGRRRVATTAGAGSPPRPAQGRHHRRHRRAEGPARRHSSRTGHAARYVRTLPPQERCEPSESSFWSLRESWAQFWLEGSCQYAPPGAPLSTK
jgi:hypothetical protein